MLRCDRGAPRACAPAQRVSSSPSSQSGAVHWAAGGCSRPPPTGGPEPPAVLPARHRLLCAHLVRAKVRVRVRVRAPRRGSNPNQVRTPLSRQLCRVAGWVRRTAGRVRGCRPSAWGCKPGSCAASSSSCNLLMSARLSPSTCEVEECPPDEEGPAPLMKARLCLASWAARTRPPRNSASACALFWRFCWPPKVDTPTCVQHGPHVTCNSSSILGSAATTDRGSTGSSTPDVGFGV